MNLKPIYNMYADKGINLLRAREVAANHAEIEIEVLHEKEIMFNPEKSGRAVDADNDVVDKITEAVQQYMDINPKTRTRADLIRAIAFMEFAAAVLRDEVADKAYINHQK